MAAFRDNFRDGAPMLLGYARVSTDDQDLALQGMHGSFCSRVR